MFTEKTLTDLDKKIIKEYFPKDYEEKFKKIKNGYPIQYIIGHVDFLNTNILVNENVLIPRFETEYLMEKVLKKVEKWKEQKLSCIDICTGSGCMAIAIAKNTNFQVVGWDISKKALEVAEENNKRNHVCVKFLEKNILEVEIDDNYDIILANPPYIDKEETVDSATKFEPQIALYAENKGLLFYEKIIKKIKNTPKLIAFEIGEKQGYYLLKIAKDKFPQARITLEKDLCGRDRYLFIEHK